jgi:hypothetical protein
MAPVPHRTLDRIGSTTGIAAIALLVVTAAIGEMPSPDRPIDAIAADVHVQASSLLVGVYTGMLMTLCLLVFGASVVAALRRAEGAQGGWWVLALVGISGTAIWILADAAAASFVRAVEHGVSGDALWIGYGLDHWIGLLALGPLGLFIIASSVGSQRTALLASWTTWLGLAAGALLIIGAGAITGDELTGGPFGAAMLLGYLLAIVWIAAVSLQLWRRSRRVAQTELAAAVPGRTTTEAAPIPSV